MRNILVVLIFLHLFVSADEKSLSVQLRWHHQFLIQAKEYEEYFESLLEVASTPISYEDDLLEVSASIGVYFVCQKNSETMSEILKKADISMYNAKKLGKNQYQIYSNIF